ncbi:hypothetical protein [Devosia sp. DBB001]|nr:hypothetical protein [Devosia sp. DBB001]
MGSSTNTTTSSTAPSNPNVTATVNKLLGGVNSAYDAGAKTYDKSLYAGVGDTTKNAWDTSLAAAKDPAYAAGISGAISDFGDIAAGKRFGTDDPGYAALRSKVADDTLTDVNSWYNAAGRMGGASNVNAASEGLGNALASLDYSNFQNDQARQERAAQMLPGLFNAGQLPGATIGAVGAAQDADQQAARQGDYDLFTRKANANTDLIAKLSSILAGNAATSGSTTTQTSPSTPWWQGALGLGLGIL